MGGGVGGGLWCACDCVCDCVCGFDNCHLFLTRTSPRDDEDKRRLAEAEARIKSLGGEVTLLKNEVICLCLACLRCYSPPSPPPRRLPSLVFCCFFVDF